MMLNAALMTTATAQRCALTIIPSLSQKYARPQTHAQIPAEAILLMMGMHTAGKAPWTLHLTAEPRNAVDKRTTAQIMEQQRHGA